MKTCYFLIFTGLLLILSLPAQAHTGIGSVHGLIDGLIHTITGVNHLLVMLGIGLWASMRGGRVVLAVPANIFSGNERGCGTAFCRLNRDSGGKLGGVFGIMLQVCWCGVTCRCHPLLRSQSSPYSHSVMDIFMPPNSRTVPMHWLIRRVFC